MLKITSQTHTTYTTKHNQTQTKTHTHQIFFKEDKKIYRAIRSHKQTLLMLRD